jgi:hypothetical protein
VELEPAVRRLLVEHHDTGTRVSAKVTGLAVVDADDDVESPVAPLVPHGRQENLAVRAVRGEDGDDGPLEQIPELLDPQVASDREDDLSLGTGRRRR